MFTRAPIIIPDIPGHTLLPNAKGSLAERGRPKAILLLAETVDGINEELDLEGKGFADLGCSGAPGLVKTRTNASAVTCLPIFEAARPGALGTA